MVGSNDEIPLWIAALERRSRRKLGRAEAAAIADLPIGRRLLPAGHHFSREGDPSARCGYIIEGTLFQTKLTRGGARQIVGLRLQNEFVGLQDLLLQGADHDVQALTSCRLLEVNAARLRSVTLQHPDLGAIFMADVMVACAIAQDWIVNVGRRDGHSRVAHLLCELALRSEAGALARGTRYALPLTQQQLGDAVGLGRVAVNRIMRDLVQRGIIAWRKSVITILDPATLEDIGDFSARYLHLGLSERERRKSPRPSLSAAPAAPAQVPPRRDPPTRPPVPRLF